MGSHNSKADSLHYDSKDWEETQKSVFYEVMRNKRGQQAQLYHFNIKDERQIDQEVDIYHRRKSAANWVQVLGANLTSSGFGFCGSQQNACVLTQSIPVLLSSVSRLNKQQSAVVLYNALRGFSDLSKYVVPAAITDKMIGFNRLGQTKVWVNENFGMNHAGLHHSEATLDQNLVLNNLINAISSKVDLTSDFLNGVKNSRTLLNALNFVKVNGGVPENVLEANRVNVASFGQQNVSVLKDTVPLQSNIQTNFVPAQTTSVFTPSTSVYQPPQQQVVQPQYRNQSVNYGTTPVVSRGLVGTTSAYQPVSYQPASYQTASYVPTGQNKFSFTTTQ